MNEYVFYDWFEQNEKRYFWYHIIQFFLCRNRHDEVKHYLDSPNESLYDSGICKRCKHLQLYAVPSFLLKTKVTDGISKEND